MSPLDEQLYGFIVGKGVKAWKPAWIGKRERRHGVIVLTVYVQQFTAGYQHPQARATGE